MATVFSFIPEDKDDEMQPLVIVLPGVPADLMETIKDTLDVIYNGQVDMREMPFTEIEGEYPDIDSTD